MVSRQDTRFSLLIRLIFDKIWHRFSKDPGKGAPMKVKELMTTKVNSLSPDMNAREALDLLFKLQISGLPVIDEHKKIIGMFTEKGILRTLLPGYIDTVGSFTYHENPKIIKQKVAALSTMQVKDVMRQEVVTVGEETTISEVARVMLVQKIRRIPVLNKDKELVGMVARVDVVKAFFKEQI